jgi:hypothetical protein
MDLTHFDLLYGLYLYHQQGYKLVLILLSEIFIILDN